MKCDCADTDETGEDINKGEEDSGEKTKGEEEDVREKGGRTERMEEDKWVGKMRESKE